MKRKKFEFDIAHLLQSRDSRLKDLQDDGGSFIEMSGHPHNEDDPIEVSNGFACFLNTEARLQNARQNSNVIPAPTTVTTTVITPTTTTVVTPVQHTQIVSSPATPAPNVPMLQLSSSEMTPVSSMESSTLAPSPRARVKQEKTRRTRAAASLPTKSHPKDDDSEDVEQEVEEMMDDEQSYSNGLARQETANAVRAALNAGWTLGRAAQHFVEKFNQMNRRRSSQMVPVPPRSPSSNMSHSYHSNHPLQANGNNQAEDNRSRSGTDESAQSSPIDASKRAVKNTGAMEPSSPEVAPASKPYFNAEDSGALKPPPPAKAGPSKRPMETGDTSTVPKPAHHARTTPLPRYPRPRGAMEPASPEVAPASNPFALKSGAVKPPPPAKATPSKRPMETGDTGTVPKKPAHHASTTPLPRYPRPRAPLPEPPQPGTTEYAERTQRVAQNMRNPQPIPALPIPSNLESDNDPPITEEVLGATLFFTEPSMYPQQPYYETMRRENPGLLLYRCRIYLKCPYLEKEIAKKRGALWDDRLKLWYVDPYTDLSDFAAWLPPGRRIPPLLNQYRVPLTTIEGDIIPIEHELDYIEAHQEGNENYRRAYSEMLGDLFLWHAHTEQRNPIAPQVATPHPPTNNHNGASTEQSDRVAPNVAAPQPVVDERRSLFFGENAENHEESNDVTLNEDSHECDYCHEQFQSEQQLREHDPICPDKKMPARETEMERKAAQQKSNDDNQQPNNTNEMKETNQQQENDANTKKKQQGNQRKDNTTKRMKELDDDSYDKNGPGEFDYDDNFLASEDDNSTWIAKKQRPRRQRKRPSFLELHSEGESPFEDDYTNSTATAEDEDDNYEDASSPSNTNENTDESDNSSRDLDKQDNESYSDCDQEEQPDNSSSSSSTSEESNDQDEDADHESSSRNTTNRHASSPTKQATIDDCMPFYERK